MLLLAASAEQHSVHPLSIAIQKYVQAQQWTVPQHRSSRTIVARGMAAVVPEFEGFSGGDVLVGSCKLMQERGVEGMELIHPEDISMGYIYVARNGMLLGALGVITPLWAAIIHNTATLAVVLNSARILAPAQKKLLR